MLSPHFATPHNAFVPACKALGSKMFFLLAVCALFGAGLMSARGAKADTMGADERLEAIRNSLVQATLEGPVEVKSTTWVDKNGALQESNSFTAGMEVRGVRVLSYTQGEGGEPKANLTQEARKNLKSSSPACAKTTFADKMSVWHHMTLDAYTAPNMNARQKFYANLVMQDLRRDLLLSSSQSRLVHFGDMTLPSSRYEQVLVGKGEEYIPWRIRMTVGLSAESLGTTPTFWVHFDVSERTLPNVFLSYEQLITIDTNATDSTPRPLSAVVMQEVKAVSDGFISTLEHKLSCIPPQFQVLKIQSDTYRINGGLMSGLRIGDRLVVADKDKIPNHVLEPAALNRMAMAQVTSVSGYYADLKQIAGPTLSGNAQWVAIVQAR
jgi:hypothetical protein